MFGLPSCAKNGCPWPGLIRVESTDDSGTITAFLCPFCVGDAPKLLEEVSAVRERERLLPDRRGDDGEKEG